MPPTILSVKPRQEDLPDAPPPKKPIQNKRFKLPLVIGALVLLCAVGVAAVLAFKEQKPSKPSKTPVTTADTTKLAQVTPPPVGTTQLNVTELTAQNSELINLLAQALQVSKDLSVQGGVSVAGNVTAASLSGSGSGLTGVDATLLDGEPSSYFSTLAGNASQAVAQLQANAALLAFPNTFAANNTFSANLKVNGTATISSLVLGSPLTTTNGGTGLSTVPAGAVLYGQGGPVLGVATPSGIGDCLMSGVGSVTWGPCVSGTGAVASLDGLGGILTLANSSGSGNTITIDNASSAAKGIASFNATDFSVVNGAVDTAQPISVTATPTFGGLTLGAALTVANGGTGATSLTANGVVLGAGTGPLTVVTAGSGGQCLVSTAGAPVFQACPGAINVSSLNSLTGAITIANATTAGSTITLNNAKADGATKGIAAFNATNFTDNGSGIINTTQDIAVTSTPTFAGITVNGQGHINTNSVTAFNVEQNGVHNNVLTVDTTNGLVGINQTPQSGIALTVNGTNQSGNFLISSGANGNYLAKNYTVGTGGVSQNDVVVLVNDAGNSRVIDTTTARDIRVMGVSHTTTGAGNPAQIVFGGNTNVTADTGAVAIGDQLVTSGTSGQVMADNSATTGIVGYATSAKAGGSSGLVGIYVHVVNGVSNPNFSG